MWEFSDRILCRGGGVPEGKHRASLPADWAAHVLRLAAASAAADRAACDLAKSAFNSAASASFSSGVCPPQSEQQPPMSPKGGSLGPPAVSLVPAKAHTHAAWP